MWVHGEMLTREGSFCQFRYDFNDSLEECLKRIRTRYMPGCRILWHKEGFIPEDTSRWGEWGMNDTIDPGNLVVEKRPI